VVRTSALFAGVILALLVGCSSEDTGGSSSAPPKDAAAESDAGSDTLESEAGDARDASAEVDAEETIAYELILIREDSPELPGFTVELHAHHGDGSPASPAGVTITCDRGEAMTEEESAEGVFARAFRPDATGTGEYEVTASVGGEPVASATALVMKSVGGRWGQPRKVEGLVNTDGWEDGANITADGEYLFIQYLPITPSCLWQAEPDLDSPECSKARGPVTGPERPGMPGADRVASDGTILHGCPSIGIPSLPIPLPPNSLFGFKRQSDGSFAEPFAVAFDGIDGCVSPFGLTFVSGESGGRTMLLAYDDPFDNDPPNTDSGGDLYAFNDVELGAPIVLGRYSLNGNQIVLDDFEGILLASTKNGHFGNPAGYQDAAGRVQVWYDNEALPEEQRNLGAIVFEAGEFPAGAGTAPQDFPSPLGEADVADIQPFFDGSEALVRKGWDIASVEYLGGDIFSEASWGAPAYVVESDTMGFVTQTTGAIVTTGEPTKAVVGGKMELYFVYGVMKADGTADLNVGVVTER